MCELLTTQELFLLFTCDLVKSYQSLRLRGIFATTLQVRQAIQVLAENGVINSVDAEMLSQEMSVAEMMIKIRDVFVVRTYLGEFESDGGYIV